MLLEIDGVRLLTDPVLRRRVGPLLRIAPLIGPRAVGRVDGVLLSHLHADHADRHTLRVMALGAKVVAPVGAARWLHRLGLRDIHELRPGDEVDVGGLSVSATPAIHERRRRPLGPVAEPIGYLVCGSRSVYFAGDTDLFGEMSGLHRSLDLALLPVWGWGPSVGKGHLDPERAARAAAMIKPAVAVPIHWGTFALGRAAASRRADPAWPANEFVSLTHEYAPAVEVRLLRPGERSEL